MIKILRYLFHEFIDMIGVYFYIIVSFIYSSTSLLFGLSFLLYCCYLCIRFLYLWNNCNLFPLKFRLRNSLKLLRSSMLLFAVNMYVPFVNAFLNHTLKLFNVIYFI